MFPVKRRIRIKEREQYFQKLVTEYQETNDESCSSLYYLDCRLQILANLANFGYDPFNNQFIRDLNIIDLFLGII